jgi:hypothetical protein
MTTQPLSSRIREAFSVSAIDFSSAPGFWRKLTLACLWCFYRCLNLIGFSHLNKIHVDCEAALVPAVEMFGDSGDFAAVYNFQATDGQIFTVMKVRGPLGWTENHHV